MVRNILIGLCACFVFGLAFAVDLSTVSANVMAPIGFVGKFFYALCYVLGIGCLLACIFQYMQHRKNPVQVRLSAPVMYLVLGVILVAIPYFAGYGGGSAFIGIGTDKVNWNQVFDTDLTPKKP